MTSLCALRSSLCALPCLPLLAAVNFRDPVLWAVMIGWVLSVVLHEFAHGLVAYWGGDYTIRMRGGLTLNPLQYIHPVNSILLPLAFLLMGGVPLPGGATYVRRDLLRNRAWMTAVSLAGPAVNFALFAVLLLPMHPTVGWLHPPADPSAWTPAEQFLAVLATLQFLTGVFNLIPVPPLDGFNAVSPYLSPELQARTRDPQFANGALIVLFVIFLAVPGMFQRVYDAQQSLMMRTGLGPLIEGMTVAINAVLHGQ